MYLFDLFHKKIKIKLLKCINFDSFLKRIVKDFFKEQSNYCIHTYYINIKHRYNLRKGEEENLLCFYEE